MSQKLLFFNGLPTEPALVWIFSVSQRPYLKNKHAAWNDWEVGDWKRSRGHWEHTPEGDFEISVYPVSSFFHPSHEVNHSAMICVATLMCWLPNTGLKTKSYAQSLEATSTKQEAKWAFLEADSLSVTRWPTPIPHRTLTTFRSCIQLMVNGVQFLISLK